MPSNGTLSSRLANLVATGQVKLGDFIRIDLDASGKMTFVKEAEGALVPVLLERYGPAGQAQAAAASKGGKISAATRGKEIGTTPRRRGSEHRWMV